MREFEARNHPGRAFLWRVVTLALMIVMAYLALATWDMYQRESATRQKRNEARAQLTEAQAREAHVLKTIDELSTDRGVEAQVRKQFEMGKDGEGLIIIVDKEVVAPSEERKPWWKF